MSGYVDCRCPKCGHKRGQATEGSGVRIQCRQCKIFADGVVKDGKFRVTNYSNYRKRIEGASPPNFIG